MKTIRKTILALAAFVALTAVPAYAQKKAEIQIKTSAECEMCKATLEKALGYTKGVKSVNLDLKTRVVTVVYNPKKTNPDALRKVINDAGYDADNMPANNKAYKKLEACCKGGNSCTDPANHKHPTDSVK
ncbi:MAG: heavy metal-associated domain-containing protein [Bacteroidota bacterium]